MKLNHSTTATTTSPCAIRTCARYPRATRIKYNLSVTLAKRIPQRLKQEPLRFSEVPTPDRHHPEKHQGNVLDETLGVPPYLDPLPSERLRRIQLTRRQRCLRQTLQSRYQRKLEPVPPRQR